MPIIAAIFVLTIYIVKDVKRDEIENNLRETNERDQNYVVREGISEITKMAHTYYQDVKIDHALFNLTDEEKQDVLLFIPGTAYDLEYANYCLEEAGIAETLAVSEKIFSGNVKVAQKKAYVTCSSASKAYLTNLNNEWAAVADRQLETITRTLYIKDEEKLYAQIKSVNNNLKSILTNAIDHKKEKLERSEKRINHISIALVAIGWGLAFIGKIFGKKGDSDPEGVV